MALHAMACGDDDQLAGAQDAAYSGPILIWNLSQFELLELYSHSYRGIPTGDENFLTEPMAPDTVLFIDWNSYEFISVVREKTAGGFLLGLTTRTQPDFYSDRSVLIVFDDGFRALHNREDANATPGFPGYPDEVCTPECEAVSE